MRPRFLAVIGVADGALRATISERLAPTFPIVHDFGDMLLFLERSTPHLMLPHAGGAVIGHVIDRANGRHLKSMASRDDRAVASSRGRHLIDKCFGTYVAFWTAPEGGTSILRDPSASLPVFMHRSAQATYAFSDIGLAVRLGLFPAVVNMEMVAHSLQFEQLTTRATAIEGIEEILPGERLDCASKEPAELLWKPWTFGRDLSARGDMSDDARLIETTIDKTLKGWASAFDHIHLELSGGLDSSILAASLAVSGATWTCGTLATDGDDADERLYAHAVADRCGVDLIEVDASDLVVDPMAPLVHVTPKPRNMRILSALAHRFAAAAAAAGTGAGAVMNGMGGDNVFAYIRSTAPIVDAWKGGGVGFALRIADDIATLTRTPLRTVYGALLRRLLVSPMERRWPPDRSFLAATLKLSPPTHPWMRGPRRIPQGLRAQIASIVRIHPFLDCVDRHATTTMIFPLLSQPVMEACLSVPSWRWVEGGHNRALARAAFASRLPDVILLRRSKGSADGLVVGAIERLRPKIRERLLDGHLARAGLLDRQRLEAGLSAPFRERVSNHGRILQLLDAELWVDSIGRLERVPLLSQHRPA